MYKRLYDFLETNNFFYEYHSTSQAVMEVLDYIYQHSDCQEVTMGIYLDLQKAFDTVNHTILIKNLKFMA